MNHKGYICPSCEQEINGFRDKLSKKEFQITDLCQKCQDKTFGNKKYRDLSQSDLESFKVAVKKDYGLDLNNDELYKSASNLLQFIEALIKYSEEDKNKGSKVVQDNPLITGNSNDKME